MDVLLNFKNLKQVLIFIIKGFSFIKINFRQNPKTSGILIIKIPQL